MDQPIDLDDPSAGRVVATRRASTAALAGARPRAVILDAADGGLAMARALVARGVPVTLVATPSNRWVTRARGIDSRVASTDDEWLTLLEQLASDGPGVLLPASDRAVQFVSQRRELVSPTLRSFESQSSPHLRLMDKASLYTIASEAGVRTPVVKRIGSHADLEPAASQAAYPSLLKPVLSHVYRDLFGTSRNILVTDPDELMRAATPALDAGLEWLVTEFVPGPETSLLGAVTVRNSDGSLSLAYTRRKLRQHPPYFGAGSVLESVPAPAAMAMARRLLDTAGFVGISSLEAKRHADTGEYVLMEINVRFPQNIGLGEAAGVDASWRIYAAIAGLPLPPQRAQRDGVKVVVPSLEVRAAPAYVRKGELSLPGLLASYRNVRNVSGLSLRDPVPVAAFAGDVAAGAVRVTRRKVRSGGRSDHIGGTPPASRVSQRSAENGPELDGRHGQQTREKAKALLPASMRPAAKRWYYRALPPARRRAMLARQFRGAARRGRALGSPLYGSLLDRVADDISATGPCWQLLADRPPSGVGQGDPLSVRLMGAVHRLVLDGHAPELAPFYPSVGGTSADDPGPAFVETVAAHQDRLLELLDRPVQTNEVARASALLSGFLLVAKETGLPLRLLELGASAGLLLRWPEYHYVEDGQTWGDPRSAVRLEGAYAAGRPSFDVPVAVSERRGCDAAPLDPECAEDRLTLKSFVWADECWRFELLGAALDVARRTPITVEKADACAWLEDALSEPADGVATVVFHSLFAHFLDDRKRAQLEGMLEAAGRRASKEAPLAHLSLEWNSSGDPELCLTTWPGATRTLATTDDRGQQIRLVQRP